MKWYLFLVKLAPAPLIIQLCFNTSALCCAFNGFSKKAKYALTQLLNIVARKSTYQFMCQPYCWSNPNSSCFLVVFATIFHSHAHFLMFKLCIFCFFAAAFISIIFNCVFQHTNFIKSVFLFVCLFSVFVLLLSHAFFCIYCNCTRLQWPYCCCPLLSHTAQVLLNNLFVLLLSPGNYFSLLAWLELVFVCTTALFTKANYNNIKSVHYIKSLNMNARSFIVVFVLVYRLNSHSPY